MKRIIPFLLVALCFACSPQNEPEVPEEDPTTKNQPADPATWSPVGKMYVSADENDFGRYDGMSLIFFSSDSVTWHRTFTKNVKYRLDYPYIFVRNEQYPWFKFIDTLTITKAYDGLDESSKYVLVY